MNIQQEYNKILDFFEEKQLSACLSEMLPYEDNPEEYFRSITYKFINGNGDKPYAIFGEKPVQQNGRYKYGAENDENWKLFLNEVPTLFPQFKDLSEGIDLGLFTIVCLHMYINVNAFSSWVNTNVNKFSSLKGIAVDMLGSYSSQDVTVVDSGDTDADDTAIVYEQKIESSAPVVEPVEEKAETIDIETNNIIKKGPAKNETAGKEEKIMALDDFKNGSLGEAVANTEMPAELKEVEKVMNTVATLDARKAWSQEAVFTRLIVAGPSKRELTKDLNNDNLRVLTETPDPEKEEGYVLAVEDVALEGDNHLEYGYIYKNGEESKEAKAERIKKWANTLDKKLNKGEGGGFRAVLGNADAFQKEYDMFTNYLEYMTFSNEKDIRVACIAPSDNVTVKGVVLRENASASDEALTNDQLALTLITKSYLLLNFVDKSQDFKDTAVTLTVVERREKPKNANKATIDLKKTKKSSLSFKGKSAITKRPEYIAFLRVPDQSKRKWYQVKSKKFLEAKAAKADKGSPLGYIIRTPEQRLDAQGHTKIVQPKTKYRFPLFLEGYDVMDNVSFDNEFPGKRADFKTVTAASKSSATKKDIQKLQEMSEEADQLVLEIFSTVITEDKAMAEKIRKEVPDFEVPVEKAATDEVPVEDLI